jgi:hypothetical protein
MHLISRAVDEIELERDVLGELALVVRHDYKRRLELLGVLRLLRG